MAKKRNAQVWINSKEFVRVVGYEWVDVKHGYLTFYVYEFLEDGDEYECEIAMFKDWSYWFEVNDDKHN